MEQSPDATASQGLAVSHGLLEAPYSEQCCLEALGALEVADAPLLFDVEDGHRLFDSSGFVCDDDIAAIIRATVLAIGVSLDKPEDDPKRRIAIISDDGREIGTVPVYSRPSYENPAQ